MDHFPLFMDLKSKKALVIGSNNIAERKIRLLLKAKANVHLVADKLTAQMIVWYEQGNLVHLRSKFETPLLDGARLVIAASEDMALNRRIYMAARHRGLPINVVDRPDLSTFIMPAIVDRGAISIAISSGGKAPMLARHIRQQIEKLLPQRLALLADIFGSWRQTVLERIPELTGRLKFWERAIASPCASAILSGAVHDSDAAFEALLQQNESEGSGEVYLVGAGPGDPELLTIKALRLMQKADVVLYDHLLSNEILDLVRRDADRISVGKKYGDHTMPQQDIGALMVKLAREGKRVLRLKGGDPFIFGRGGEEMEDLATANIAFQVVPGITAASGCAAYAGIPLTHRDHAQSVRFLTGHTRNDRLEMDWPSLVQAKQTLAIYMGTRSLPELTAKLKAHGLGANTPLALIENGTRKDQRKFIATLDTINDKVSAADLSGPGLVIIGSVVTLAERCHWFDDTADKSSSPSEPEALNIRQQSVSAHVGM